MVNNRTVQGTVTARNSSSAARPIHRPKVANSDTKDVGNKENQKVTNRTVQSTVTARNSSSAARPIYRPKVETPDTRNGQAEIRENMECKECHRDKCGKDHTHVSNLSTVSNNGFKNNRQRRNANKRNMDKQQDKQEIKEETINIKLNKNTCTMDIQLEDGLMETCLVDSGAADSVIARDMINKSNYLRNLNTICHATSKRYITGSGNEMFSNTTITFRFKVQDHTLETTAYILPTCGSFSFIYGLSSLKEAEAILDLKKNMVQLTNRRIPMRPKNHIKLSPGESQVISLRGKIPNNLNNISLFMGFTKSAGKYLPEECLVTINKNTTEVCVKNTTAKKVYIRPTWILGHIKVNSILDSGETLEGYAGVIPAESETKLPMMSITKEEKKKDRYKSNNMSKGGAWSVDIHDLPTKYNEYFNPTPKYPSEPNSGISDTKRKLRESRIKELALLDEDNPDLFLSDEEMLRRDIELDSSLLSEEYKEKVMDMILENREAFSLFGEVGKCKNSNVSIALKNEEAFFIRPFRYSEEDKQVIKKEIDKMVKQGILVKSPATHVSPVLLVKKKQTDGTMKYRIVVDFRVLNERLVKPIYAQNLIQDAINRIGEKGAKFVTLIDLKEAYHALSLDPKSSKYTGVIPYFGKETYKYCRLPMGLSVSGAEFTNKILDILNKIDNFESFCCNILDDIIITSKDEQSHLEHLTTIIELFNKEGLKISPKKTKIAHQKFSYMGYELTFNERGNPIMRIEKSKVEAIRKLPKPKSPKGVKSFIGMVQYLARFLPKLNVSLIPLYELTKKSVPFKWTKEHQEIFEKLKHEVTVAPAVSLPTRDGQFLVEVDTSRIGTGSMLQQYQDGEVKIIAFNSKKLPAACLNYSVSELELHGLEMNLRAYKAILGNRRFLVLTDHKALLGLLKSRTEPPTTRLARLIEKLLAYNFSLGYKKGSTLIMADYLSRNPLEDDNPDIEIIPIALAEMTPEQANETMNSILNNYHSEVCPLTRSQAKAQNIVIPSVNEMGPPDVRRKRNEQKQPGKRQTDNEDTAVKTYTNVANRTEEEAAGENTTILDSSHSDPDRRFSLRLRNMNRHISEEDWPKEEITTNTRKNRETIAENPFFMAVPQPINQDLFNEEQGITQEEDTIRAISGTDELTIKPEIQLDIEKHLIPTSGTYITESIDPPNNDCFSKETQQLFDKISKSKLFNYRFSKQADIDPLLRVIDQRHLSQYRVGFTKQKLTEETKQDERLGPIYNYLLCGKAPRKPAEMSRVMSSVDNYFIYDDALFFYESANDEKDIVYRLCIPKSLIRYILDTYHRQNLGSHLGISRTFSTLNAKYRIHGLYRQIVNYIKSCDLCQQKQWKSGEKSIIFPRELNDDLRPFQRFSCDLRNMNMSSGGHKYLFVAVCDITHYVKAYPMKKPTARAIANLILNKFIFEHGKPEMILFDLARYFCSKIMGYLSEAINFKIKFIYKSQHHASRVERYMRSIKNSLIAHLANKTELWTCFVAPCLYALNTFKSPALANYSAYELVYKHEPSTMDGFELQPITGICKDLEEYITMVKKKYDIARATVREYNDKIQDKRFMQSARENNKKQVKVGDVCNLLNPENTKVYSSDNKAIRLHYVGPYICAGRDKSAIFLEKLDGTYLSHPVYADRVKPTAIQTQNGKIIKNKTELLEYLGTREDIGAALLKKGLTDGKIKFLDTDGLPVQEDNTLMSLSIPTNDKITKETLKNCRKPQGEWNYDYEIGKEKDKSTNEMDVETSGRYDITKARFKNGMLQGLITNTNVTKKGKDCFWVTLEESFLWEKALDTIKQNKIRVTGSPYNLGKKDNNLLNNPGTVE